MASADSTMKFSNAEKSLVVPLQWELKRETPRKSRESESLVLFCCSSASG